jgi:hypothetical protein
MAGVSVQRVSVGIGAREQATGKNVLIKVNVYVSFKEDAQFQATQN